MIILFFEIHIEISVVKNVPHTLMRKTTICLRAVVGFLLSHQHFWRALLMRLRIRTSSNKTRHRWPLRFLEEYPCPFVTYTGIERGCRKSIFVLSAVKTNELLEGVCFLQGVIIVEDRDKNKNLQQDLFFHPLVFSKRKKTVNTLIIFL